MSGFPRSTFLPAQSAGTSRYIRLCFSPPSPPLEADIPRDTFGVPFFYAPPYALTRAPQGAMRVDRQSRIHRILGLVPVPWIVAPLLSLAASDSNGVA